MRSKLCRRSAFKLEKACVSGAQPFLFGTAPLGVGPNTVCLVFGWQALGQTFCTESVVSGGLKIVNSGHSGLTPIPYPCLSEVTPEFSLLILDEASEPHLRF